MFPKYHAESLSKINLIFQIICTQRRYHIFIIFRLIFLCFRSCLHVYQQHSPNLNLDDYDLDDISIHLNWSRSCNISIYALLRRCFTITLRKLTSINNFSAYIPILTKSYLILKNNMHALLGQFSNVPR